MFIKYEIKDKNMRVIAYGYDWKDVMTYADNAINKKEYDKLMVYSVYRHYEDVLHSSKAVYLEKVFK